MNWLQQKDEPLFPDLIWSKPQNKKSAGKLLIIGGQAREFINVSEAFAASEEAGAGYIKLLLPESLRKLTQALPDVEYSSANASGSFAKSSLADFTDLSNWADHVLLAGDFGKSSETTVLLENFISKCQTSVTISELALEGFNKKLYLEKTKNITYVLNFTQLQKLGTDLKSQTAITSKLPLQSMAKLLIELSEKNKLTLVAVSEDTVWSVHQGQVSSTQASGIDSTKLAAYSAVWEMQHPAKIFEALTTSVSEIVL